MSSLDRILVLPDGRRLAYAEFGDPTGSPVLFLHGWGDSRLTRHPDDALTASLGVRLVTVDRPGTGLSDFQPGRRLLDWPADVRHLADSLGIDRFAVLGHSGAGPHALACGLRLADRLTAVGVACGFAPMDRPGATEGMRDEMRRFVPLLRRFPWIAQLVFRSLPAEYRRDPQRAFDKQYGHNLPASDRAALADPAMRAMLLAGAVESLRGGSRGMAHEISLFMARPWGFQPEDISLPTWLWYAEDDPIVPPQMGRYLAQHLPNAHLTLVPDAGHMLVFTHWAEILGVLAARRDLQSCHATVHPQKTARPHRLEA